MTIYNWSSLTTNQSLAFDPANDQLAFDDPSISAAMIGLNYTPDSGLGSAAFVRVIYGTKTITLSSTDIRTLTTSNVTFANGSLLIVGDNGVASSADDSANTINGSAQADYINGLGGDDIINAGDGNDLIYKPNSDGSDNISGGNGNDTIIITYRPGFVSQDTVDGGAGTDVLNYQSSSITPAITVNMAQHIVTSEGGRQSIQSIERVLGTNSADTFIAGAIEHKIDSLGKTTVEVFRGNGGNDTITGVANSDPKWGNDIDYVTGADYSNNTSAQAINANLHTGRVIDGLGGTDTLTWVSMVYGGAGNDTFTGGSLTRGTNGMFWELFRGNGGDDTMDGANSFSDGGVASSDRADYSNNTAAQAINVDMTTGKVRDGWGGTDTLIDIDQVWGGAGNDTFLGGDANETFDGGAGSDTIDGGAGVNRVSYRQSTSGVIVNVNSSSIIVDTSVYAVTGMTGTKIIAAGTANDGMGGTDVLRNLNHVWGSDYNDYLSGSDIIGAKSLLAGFGGNNYLVGGAGIGIADYGSLPPYFGFEVFVASLVPDADGKVTVNNGLGGVDTLINIKGLAGTNGADSLTGGAGDEYFRGNGGDDTIDGGAGNDWVLYNNSPSGVTVNLETGVATDGWDGQAGLLALGGTDTLRNIENVEGSTYADSLTGNSGDNLFRGLSGDDTLDGGAGDDTAIYAGAKADYVITRLANGSYTVQDMVSGRDGTDAISNVEHVTFRDGVFNLADLSPSITSDATASIAENISTTTSIYTVAASRPQANAPLTYSIVGGADREKFVIDRFSGEVTFVDSPDFERRGDSGGDNVYDIVVRASDGSLYTDKAVAITVTDVAEKAPPVPPPVAFATPKTYATGVSPGSVVISDFNGDKKQDMVIANYVENTVSVLLGEGDGGFKEKVDVAVGAGPLKVSLGDFNGDGEQDIVVTNTTDDTVSILLGKGDGTFQAQSVYDTGDYPQWVSVADLDKDGTADLIVANYHSINSISVLLGNADGTFRAQETYETGPRAVSLTTGDFNKDNKRDIVVSNFGDNTISILQGNGDGTFQPQRAFGTGSGPQSIIAVDVNHDDKLDLVVQSYYGDSVGVHLGNGDGTFGAQLAYQVGRTPGEITVADLNGDDHPDIVAPNFKDGTVSILLGNGDGTFQTQQVFKVGNGANSVAIRDVNGDGQADLVVVNHQDDTVSVLLNETRKSPKVTAASHARNDFDGDSRSDILLQNGADGSCYVWQMNGLSFKPEGVGFVGWTPPSNQWRAVGTGDFDHDGKSDIFLQNGADGSCYVWEMDGLSFKPEGVGYVGWTPPTNQWRAVGTGDFDGDGMSDILLQDGDTGDCFVWEMNGLSVKESGYVGWRPPSKEWRAVGTGDFDGDGMSDILLQDGATGDCYVWEMEGLKVKEDGFGYVGWTPPSKDWRAVGTGDFDGDGKSDILLQNGADGSCYVWEMEGLKVKESGFGYVGWTPPSNEWRAVGTGDYNGDGMSDILLQDGATGDCFVWEMKGLELLNETSFGYVGWRPPSADWHATA